MSKRKRFIIISLVLSLGFLGIQFFDQYRFIYIGLLGLTTASLFYWSLSEGIGKNMTLLSLVLPTLFTLGVGVFWFLLSTNFLARIPIVLMYGIGIYVLALTMNIYTVSASIRTIALLRAARGVGFVLTLLTSFLIFDAIFSLRVFFMLNALLVFLFTFPLYLQGFWAIELEEKLNSKLIMLSLICSLISAEITVALYFWPVTVVVGSLFLSATFYMLLGLGQSKLEGRLFKATIREYLLVGLFVFVGMYFATRWG